MYYPAIALIVFSNVLYHVCQKSTPGGVNPIMSLLVAYGVAVITTVFLLLFFPLKESVSVAVLRLNWASVLLGFAVVGIELGFLLAYRYGSNIGNTQFYATTMLTLVLIPLGIIFFHEKLSVINVAGIAVCIVGFIMMHHRG